MVDIKYTGDCLRQRIDRAEEMVAQVDESVVRNTRDVDIIIDRTDLPAAIEALAQVGFFYRHSAGVAMFLDGPDARTLPLESLVRMKLTSYRRKDQVHVLDMISVGLIDASWLERLSPVLADRLQELLDDPEG